jgi:hypothetical protein
LVLCFVSLTQTLQVRGQAGSDPGTDFSADEGRSGPTAGIDVGAAPGEESAPPVCCAFSTGPARRSPASAVQTVVGNRFMKDLSSSHGPTSGQKHG